MQKTTLPVGIRTLKGWKEKGILTFDNPIQRAGSQWSNLQKSLLIHSLLAGYPIPACYFLKFKNDDGVMAYDCLDAKQRLTSIFEFMDGGYSLNAATPPYQSDDGEVDLADVAFEGMDSGMQDEISGARLTIYCLEDCSDEEVEEIFSRLNNAAPLSAVQKCRSIMGSDLAGWAKKVCAGGFFTHGIALTLAQLRREADLEVLLQSMLLLSSRLDGYEDWKGISTADVAKYCGAVRQGYLKPPRLIIESCADFLAQAFQQRHKFLKKSNIPMVFALSRIALEHKVSPQEFKAFIDSFGSADCPDYDANTGSGNVKRAKTEGRLLAIAKAFGTYFNISGINILDAPIGYDKLLSDDSEEEFEGDGFEEPDLEGGLDAGSFVDELLESSKSEGASGGYVLNEEADDGFDADSFMNEPLASDESEESGGFGIKAGVQDAEADAVFEGDSSFEEDSASSASDAGMDADSDHDSDEDSSLSASDDTADESL